MPLAMTLSFFIAVLLLLLNCAASTTASGSESQGLIRVWKRTDPGRYCHSPCFVGPKSWHRALHHCPRWAVIVRCNRSHRKGFRCRCPPPRPHRRLCRGPCFVGRRSWSRAFHRCPSRANIVPCRRYQRRGYRCHCPRFPHHPPSPTPSATASPSPTASSSASPSPSASSSVSPSPSASPAATVTASVLVGSNPNATVLVCTTTQLFIQVSSSSNFTAGNVFWALPTKLQSSCTNCNSLARRITSVSAAASFGSTKCPTGRTCITAETEYATLGDLISAQLLDTLDIPAAAASTPVEPDFGCNLQNSSRALAVSARQAGAAVPSSCNAWARKNGDGRCTYSDCFVGKQGNPVNCLFCKAKCDNGCGPANPVKNALIPDSIPLVFDFRAACCNHDKCYTSFFSQSECDEAFLRDTRRSCADELSDILYYIPLPIPVIGGRLRCPILAQIYYFSVKYGGKDSYDDAQKSRKEHEVSKDCVARCPTTQRSGGQGVTTLNVDLKKTSGTFDVTYQMYSIPDKLEVFYEGKVIFTTGGLVSGGRTVPVTYSGNSTFVRVTMTAPRSGTAWDVSVACPP